MSELDRNWIFSRADGGVWLIPKSGAFEEWVATMFATTEKGKRIYNDLCSPGTPEGKADLMKKVERAKAEGWHTSSIEHRKAAA